MKWMKKKEPTPSLTPPPSQSFTIPPNLYPTLPFSVGSYKLDFFSLFPIKFWGTLFSIQYHFFLNLSHVFRLFAATLFPKFLILLSSFRKLLNEKNQCKKVGRKLRVLVIICIFMAIERKRILMKSFIES